ncbi:hypothetical protein KQX54_013716 [Cotesia glomerata]|uniref:Uncharacterized protein n=1 Tax=Cotesia glomerata TaxID=32391 RepID=A0AAV7IHX0_COTGL|nr:hypothetical protein KQX54_013716 [Cotesia glomerata]
MMEHRQFLEGKKMGSNEITYWKFITGNREDLVKLLNNDNFLSQELLKEIEEETWTDFRFFYYREPLMENFFYAVGKSKALKKLIEEVSNMFRAVLPYDCCRHIVHLMTNDEVSDR